MKVKVILEFTKKYIEFIMKEGNILSSDELKGFLRGAYGNLLCEEGYIKDIKVEVENE